MPAVTRIVLVKLSDDHATAAGRAAFVARTRAVFDALPLIVGYDLDVGADETTLRQWDVCLRVHFARAEDVEPYRVHPAHVAYVREVLEPVSVVKKAWNFAPAAS